MKKVLILAYDFPPYVSVGGLRPYSWYKYFHEFGLYPIVVTRQWGNQYGNHLDYIAPGESDETIVEESEHGAIIRTPYKPNLSNRLLLKYGEKKFRLLRKAITAWYEFMQFLFFVGTKARLYRGAKVYLENHKIDAIVATGEPFILFRYASVLSKKFKIPWMADYRDPWSQNKYRSRNFLLKTVNRFFERQAIKNAQALITVSNYFKRQIQEVIKDKKFYIIPNGYNSEIIEHINQITPSRKTLTISFAGTIYNWHPWRNVLTVISEFLNENKSSPIVVNFIGANILQEIKSVFGQNPNLKHTIQLIPRLNNNQLIEYLAKSNLLLLFNDYSILGTKIYDYLAVKRNILFCYSDDKEANELKQKYYPLKVYPDLSEKLQEELIETTNSGYIIKDSQHLKKKLKELYNEFNKKGYIPNYTCNHEIYSRKNSVKSLAKTIDDEILI